MSKFHHTGFHNHKNFSPFKDHSKNHNSKNKCDDDHHKDNHHGKNHHNNHDHNGHQKPPVQAPIISVEDDITVVGLYLKSNTTIKTVTFTDVQGIVYSHTFTNLNPVTFTNPNVTWTSLTIDPAHGGIFYYQNGLNVVGLDPSIIQYTTNKSAVVKEIQIINYDNFTNFGSINGIPEEGKPLTLISNSTSDFAETGVVADNMTMKGAHVTTSTIDPDLDIYHISVDSYKPGDSFTFTVLFEPYIQKTLPTFVQFGNDKTTASTHLIGTSGSDFQIGGLNPKGFSTLEGRGGPDNLISVAGNAKFIIDDISLVSAQGFEKGHSVFQWNNAGDLFLNIEDHLYNRMDLDNIDKIDLGKGAAFKATNHLLITAEDVLDMTHEKGYVNPITGKFQAAHTLFIDGKHDVVYLEDLIPSGLAPNWTKTGDHLYSGYTDYISVVDGITVHLEVHNGLKVI